MAPKCIAICQRVWPLTDRPNAEQSNVETGCYFGLSTRPTSIGAAWLDLVACLEASISSDLVAGIDQL